MRIILFSSTFFLLLIASMTNARHLTPVESGTITPTSTIPPTYTLIGTVSADIALDTLMNAVTLTNVSTTSTPTITVVVTNPLPSGGGYTLLTPNWQCETSGERKSMYVCSTQVGSLSVDESVHLRLDHELHVPTYECGPEGVVPDTHAATQTSNQPAVQGEYGAYRACYIEILSPQALVSLSDSSRFELSPIEPLLNSVCSCGVVATPPSTIAPPHTIQGIVWHDTNGDGVQNDGGRGVEDVIVDLLDSSGAVVDSTTTGIGGWYIFTSVASDLYTVQVMSPPPDVLFTPIRDEEFDAEASYDSNVNDEGRSALLDLSSDVPTIITVNAGYYFMVQLDVELSTGYRSVTRGESLSFTVAVSNTGPVTATNVQFMLYLPAFTIIDLALSTPLLDCEATDQVCHISVDALPVGECQQFKLGVVVQQLMPPEVTRLDLALLVTHGYPELLVSRQTTSMAVTIGPWPVDPVIQPDPCAVYDYLFLPIVHLAE